MNLWTSIREAFQKPIPGLRSDDHLLVAEGRPAVVSALTNFTAQGGYLPEMVLIAAQIASDLGMVVVPCHPYYGTWVVMLLRQRTPDLQALMQTTPWVRFVRTPGYEAWQWVGSQGPF